MNGSGSSVVRLVETATDPLPSDRRYISLSYCWGSSPTFRKLEASSVQSLKNGWAANKLCQTFQDAFAASTRIGVKLIWIDALCIIRDSKADWDAESVTMAKVYSYAFVNLAAAASVDAEGGLFRHRRPALISPFKLQVNWPGYAEGDFLCVQHDPWMTEVVYSPLLSRAWVFPERLLSLRTVFFARNQLFWECGDLYASESIPARGGPWDIKCDRFGLSRQYYSSRKNERTKDRYAELREMAGNRGEYLTRVPGALDAWCNIVEDYSRRRLTYESDRLVAISSVASQFSGVGSSLAGGYCWGLWRAFMPRLLLWRSHWGGPLFSPNGPRKLTALAPSWSWASISAPVECMGPSQYSKTPRCIEILGLLPTSGAMSVSGQLCEGRVVRRLTRHDRGPLAISPTSYKKMFQSYSGYSWKPLKACDNRHMTTRPKSFMFSSAASRCSPPTLS